MGDQCEKLARQVAERMKPGFTVPWELIIPVVIALLEQCFNAETNLVEAARGPSVFQMVMLRRICRRHLRGSFAGLKLLRAANMMANEIVNVGLSASDGDLTVAYRERNR